jgi:hypothetical protein
VSHSKGRSSRLSLDVAPRQFFLLRQFFAAAVRSSVDAQAIRLVGDIHGFFAALRR